MKFEVDTALLDNDIRTMESDLEALRKCGETMHGAMESLSGMWMGEAHDAFVVQFENDDQVLRTFFDELQSEIGELRTAKENYESCENTVKGSISGISV